MLNSYISFSGFQIRRSKLIHNGKNLLRILYKHVECTFFYKKIIFEPKSQNAQHLQTWIIHICIYHNFSV